VTGGDDWSWVRASAGESLRPVAGLMMDRMKRRKMGVDS